MIPILQKLFSVLSVLFYLILIIYFLAQMSILRLNTIEAFQHPLDTLLEDYLMQLENPKIRRSFLEIAAPLIADKRMRLIFIRSADNDQIELWSLNQSYIKEDSVNTVLSTIHYNIILEELLIADKPESPYEIRAVINSISLDDLMPILGVIWRFIVGHLLLVLSISLVVVLRKIARKSINKNPNDTQSVKMDDIRVEQSRKSTPEISTGIKRGYEGESTNQINEIKKAEEAKKNTSKEEREANMFTVNEHSIWPRKLLKIRLHNELIRSAENHTDLGFAIIHLGKIFQNDVSLTKKVVDLFLDIFRYEDMVYYIKPHYYGVIFQDRESSECLKELQFFLHLVWKLLDTSSTPHDEIHIGYSTRNGRLMGGDRLFTESMRAVNLAERKKNRIVNFKADLHKYQTFLLENPL